MTPGDNRWAWPVLACAVAILPFVRGLTGSHLFYIRDLSMYFWPRYLWLRRAWTSGEWPLWDPYIAAGQAAYADALHQMFLLPSILVRLAGGEVLGFNLWVALPFPVAAVGAWGLFARRFSGPASALGALAFALCGTIVSTGNFPNLSWSAAAMPWVLWATDRVAASATPRRVAALAIAVAMQALAGEPVTQFATLLLALGYAWVLGPAAAGSMRQSVRQAAAVVAGAGLGILLAAIQLIPMAHAAALAQRSDSISQDVWSLRPTAIVEMVWLHLFGNYFGARSLADVPWMPLLFTWREPFFFSIYFGVPLLALALFGLAATGPRRWRLFWVTAGLGGLVAAFGAYTPIYPIVRDYAPLVGSFRFPVKYLVVSALAVAAGAAAGWDVLAGYHAALHQERRFRRGRLAAIGLALVVGGSAGLLALGCLVLPSQAAAAFTGFARALDAEAGPSAGEFMLRTLPQGAVPVVMVSLVTAILLWVATRTIERAGVARWTLSLLIVGDLLVRAWGINPVLDARHLAEPAWISHTRADPHSRVYVGGKQNGALTTLDIDAASGYLNAPGLTGSASRAALSTQAAYYPSAWKTREMLSFDLAVLWPPIHSTINERLMTSSREVRDRFLDRTGVRYRILNKRQAGGRTPIMPIPQFYESFLFDAGEVTPRVSVVPDVRVVPETQQQVKALFEPGWDSRTTALVDRVPDAAGDPGTPEAPFATFVADTSNRVVIEAGAGEQGGYLVLLDSYSPDWRVTVDGQPADMVRANGLFRAVRLTPGRHTVEFAYRPKALVWGAAVSGLALVGILGLLVLGGRRRHLDPRRRAQYN